MSKNNIAPPRSRLKPLLKEKFPNTCLVFIVPLGVSVATHAEHNDVSLFELSLPSSTLSPPLFTLLSPTLGHLVLSASGPHRLVVRVVGRPWPQALIGVEVHGVGFLPNHLLQSYSSLRESEITNN